MKKNHPITLIVSAIAITTIAFPGLGIAEPAAVQPASGFEVEADTVALWDFSSGDENFLILDLSPSGIDLQPSPPSDPAPPSTEGTLSWVEGPFGEALNFPGNIHFRPGQGTSREVDLSSGNVTVEAWINPSAMAEGRQLGILQYWGTEGSGFRLSIHPGRKVTWLVKTPDGEGGVSSSEKVPDEAWTHVAGTYDGHTLRVYVNGEFSGETELEDGVVQPLGNRGPEIGMISSGDLPIFQGQMRGIRISNTARDTFVIE